MDDPLVDQLKSCCVQVRGTRQGAGFFVGPGRVVTCAHVVGDDRAAGSRGVEVEWGSSVDENATIVQILPASDEDIALIEVNFGEHPCVLLGTEELRGEELFAYGFPDHGSGPQGDGLTSHYESRTQLPGLHSDRYFHKFKDALVNRGFSGGPLLNLRTGRVIGVLTETRETRSAAGGWAVPADFVLAQFSDIERAQATFSAKDKTWERALDQDIRIREAAERSRRARLSGRRAFLPYATNIDNFVAHYLGDPSNPEPFGGREEDLDTLTRWLDDPNAEPYQLLTAPAGRGKSALLVRWVDRLMTRTPTTSGSEVQVIFIPVSVRYQLNTATAVFSALTMRLAHLHGDDPHGFADMSGDQWRERFLEYLRRDLPDGTRLLIVLDGLDEAADWDIGPSLLPHDPVDGVRVVLSARLTAARPHEQYWLEKLGWHGSSARSLTLDQLSLEGVRDVVLRMGAPLDVLADQSEIVLGLHRLSEGDPLLLSLYVKDLWTQRDQATRLSVEGLVQLRPGLEGYFARWWEDQQELWGEGIAEKTMEVRIVFNVLASAVAPLERRDLLQLVRKRCQIDGDGLDAALKTLARFVIQYNSRRAYVIAHPKFAMYRFDKLKEDGEHAEYEAVFLEWGQQALAASAEADLETLSSYIVQFYGVHLERAGSGPEAFLALVSAGWRRAWETLSDAYDGFLSDVDRAWRSVSAADKDAILAGQSASFLSGEVCCALAEADASTVAEVINSELLLELVGQGVWTVGRGLSYTRSSERGLIQTEGLARIASYLALETIPIAVSVVEQYSDWDPEDYVPAFSAIAARLLDLGQAAQALELVRSKPDAFTRAYALIELAPRLAPNERARAYSEILDCIASEESTFYRRDLIQKLTHEIPKDIVDEALNAAPERSMRSSSTTADVDILYRVCRLLQDTPTGLESEDLSELVDSGQLHHVAPWVPEPKRTEMLRRAIEGLHGAWDTVIVGGVIELAPYLEDETLEVATMVAESISNKAYLALALLALLPRMAPSRRAKVENQILAATAEAAKSFRQ